jgi:hypothetical protein
VSELSILYSSREIDETQLQKKVLNDSFFESILGFNRKGTVKLNSYKDEASVMELEDYCYLMAMSNKRFLKAELSFVDFFQIELGEYCMVDEDVPELYPEKTYQVIGKRLKLPENGVARIEVTLLEKNYEWS